MGKKKFYLIFVGTVFAISMLAFLIVVFGNKKTVETNNATTETKAVESVDDNDTGVENTTHGDENNDTSDEEQTTTDIGETSEPEIETTNPGNDPTGSDEETVYEKGDITADGYVYYPNFDIEDPKELNDFIKKYSPREDFQIVKFVDGEFEGIVSREDDVIQVIKRNDSEKTVTMFSDDGSKIFVHEKYDSDRNISYIYRESSDSSHTTESYFNNGIETRTLKYKTTGETKVLKVKTVTIGETAYQRLIYIDTGKDMVQSFEYADFTNSILSKMTVSEGGKTYTWNMDGKGNGIDNIISLTIGENTIPRKNINLMNYTTPPGQMNNY